MKRGEMVGYNGCLGYNYDPETKTISVNEEEAEIVRYIFNRYVEGAGCFVISKELSKLGYKTRKGSTRWHESTVRGIVKNEKYKGDLLQGKTFTVDPITHRRLDDMVEREKFYIENNHEPIISDEMFERAQEILRMRSSKHGTKHDSRKYSRKHSFSSIVLVVSAVERISEEYDTMEQIMKNWHGSVVRLLKMVERNAIIQKVCMRVYLRMFF